MPNNITGRDGKGRDLVCNFCGRSQKQVEQLIIGPGVNICKDCIDMCYNALNADADPRPPRAGAQRRSAMAPAHRDFGPAEHPGRGV